MDKDDHKRRFELEGIDWSIARQPNMCFHDLEINDQINSFVSHFLFIYFFGLFAISRAAPAAYGGSQARG